MKGMNSSIFEISGSHSSSYEDVILLGRLASSSSVQYLIDSLLLLKYLLSNSMEQNPS
jgi:hypothetical protein